MAIMLLGTLKNNNECWLIDSTDNNAELTLDNVKIEAYSGVISNGKLAITGGSVVATNKRYNHFFY